MKKGFYMLLTLASLSLMQSCSKSVDGVTKQEVINADVVAGTAYSLNLSTYGSVATITKQAANYTTSQIAKQSNAIVYNYVASSAKLGATTDQVVLAVTNAKSGQRNCAPADSTIVTINFTVK